MPSNNYIYKMSNAGGMSTVTRYTDMLAGNAAFVDTSYQSIATVTASGSTSSLQFTSIPSTYQHLQLRLITRSAEASTISYSNIRFNGDTGSNYAFHYLTGNGSSAGYGANASATDTFGVNMPGASALSNTYAVAIYDFLDYANTNKYKTLRALDGYDLNGSGEIFLGSGLWQSTSAINRIDFSTGSNFATGTTLALYGIKG
jgi:hypothetical protein